MTSRLRLATSFLFALVMVSGTAVPSAAAPVTLGDRNTLIEIDPNSQAGMYTWRVDGTDNLFQRWFWYRIGAFGSESSIDTISPAAVTGFGASSDGTLTYENAALRIDVTYRLTGGTPGSLSSNLSEQVRVTNRTRGTLDLHFFEYTDFDLVGTAGDDTAVMVSPTEVLQTDGQTIITAGASLSAAPSRHEVNFFSATRDGLNDAGPTTLNDVSGPLGPGDVTWAFQWDAQLPAGGTLLIDTSLNDAVAIPEPASLLLFLGVGVAGVGARRVARRRKKAQLLQVSHRSSSSSATAT